MSCSLAVSGLSIIGNATSAYSFSVTQNDQDVQFDVCTNGSQVAIDASCPAGSTLIRTYLYSFKTSSAELEGFVPPEPVPEPAATAGLILLGIGGFWLKRRQS